MNSTDRHSNSRIREAQLQTGLPAMQKRVCASTATFNKITYKIMPNWCSNTVEICTLANPEKFLVQKGDHKYLMFEKVVPLGEWDYDRAVIEWGTKWDIAHIGEDGEVYSENSPVEVIDNNDGTYTVTGIFETAWGPPIEYYEKLYEMLTSFDPNSMVSAEYWESGMGICGRCFNGSHTDVSFNGMYIEELEGYVCYDDETSDILYNFEQCYTYEDAIAELKRMYHNGYIDRIRYAELKEMVGF